MQHFSRSEAFNDAMAKTLLPRAGYFLRQDFGGGDAEADGRQVGARRRLVLHQRGIESWQPEKDSRAMAGDGFIDALRRRAP